MGFINQVVAGPPQGQQQQQPQPQMGAAGFPNGAQAPQGPAGAPQFVAQPPPTPPQQFAQQAPQQFAQAPAQQFAQQAPQQFAPQQFAPQQPQAQQQQFAQQQFAQQAPAQQAPQFAQQAPQQFAQQQAPQFAPQAPAPAQQQTPFGQQAPFGQQTPFGQQAPAQQMQQQQAPFGQQQGPVGGFANAGNPFGGAQQNGQQQNMGWGGGQNGQGFSFAHFMSGMGNEQANDGSRIYFRGNGTHIAQINKVSAGVGKDSMMPYFSVEWTVLTSTSPANPPGYTPTWTESIKDGKMLKRMKERVKAFMKVALQAKGMNVPDQQIDENAAAWAASVEQPLKGLILMVNTQEVPTAGGGVFTQHSFMAVPPGELQRLGLQQR